jgi:hypothetical protein
MSDPSAVLGRRGITTASDDDEACNADAARRTVGTSHAAEVTTAAAPPNETRAR